MILAKNLLIVSSESGSEDAAKVEVLDALLFHDPEVKLVETKHKDLFLVITGLKPLKAHSLIIGSLPRHISRVIPVEELCQTDLRQIKESCLRLISGKKAKSFAVRAKVRGLDLSPSSIERDIGAFIKSSTGFAVNLENPDLICYVEILGELAGITVLPGRFPVSVRSLRHNVTYTIRYISDNLNSVSGKEGEDEPDSN